MVRVRSYMNVVEDIQPDFMLFFPTVHAAVRFTATAHVALMEADERLHISSAGIKMWRSLAPQETSLSGNLLFKGPRLAFFIDTVPESTVSVSSVEYEPEEVAVTSSGQNLLQRAFVGSMWDTLAGEDTLGRMETGEASVKRYGRDGRGGAGDVSVCRRRTVHDVSIRPSRADSTVVKGGLFTRKTSTNVLTEPDVGDQQQRLFDKFHMRGGDKMLTGLSLERVREVCHMAWGGQTVLSDNAWVCVQTTLPVGLQVSVRLPPRPHLVGVPFTFASSEHARLPTCLLTYSKLAQNSGHSRIHQPTKSPSSWGHHIDFRTGLG